ncbi:hypothetical protein [Clostridium hydrogeniformans]|uniref:hypothetical protein n=1 Tax=Clostridium hydrogeniformans TaxID=349933 RepID=UPI0004805361|nr:hypothetical protein [Clostridium hydrogeniformans]
MVYSFKDFCCDLDKGREFDIKYKNRIYGISTGEKGICFLRYGYMGDIEFFKDSKEFIDKATLREGSLENLWDDIEVRNIF